MCAWTQDTFCIKRKYKENEKTPNTADHFKNIEIDVMGKKEVIRFEETPSGCQHESCFKAKPLQFPPEENWARRHANVANEIPPTLVDQIGQVGQESQVGYSHPQPFWNLKGKISKERNANSWRFKQILLESTYKWKNWGTIYTKRKNFLQLSEQNHKWLHVKTALIQIFQISATMLAHWSKHIFIFNDLSMKHKIGNWNQINIKAKVSFVSNSWKKEEMICNWNQM